MQQRHGHGIFPLIGPKGHPWHLLMIHHRTPVKTLKICQKITTRRWIRLGQGGYGGMRRSRIYYLGASHFFIEMFRPLPQEALDLAAVLAHV
jgi:hypothetical protein